MTVAVDIPMVVARLEAWLETMRASIGSALWQFSTARMLTEYVDRLYLPAVRSLVEA